MRSDASNYRVRVSTMGTIRIYLQDNNTVQAIIPPSPIKNLESKTILSFCCSNSSSFN